MPSDALTIRLFHRHFTDPVAAFKRLEAHLASVELPFELGAQTRELIFPPQPNLPDGLPSFIYYFVPNSGRGNERQSAENPLHESFVNRCDGIGLNLGCPVRLLRALDALSQLDASDQREPRAALRNARQHLSAVEELLWLRMWKSPSNLRRGGRFPGMDGDIDWAIEAAGFPLLLEAKFRVSDWPRLTDQGSYSGMGDGFLSRTAHKFPNPPRAAALHVVGITIYDELTDEILPALEQELNTIPQVHAVVFRSLSNVIDVVSLNRGLAETISQLLAIPDVNDYPVPNLFFHIEQRDSRVSQRGDAGAHQRSMSAVLSRNRFLPRGTYPFPMPEPGAYRLGPIVRSDNGEPHFTVIPRYLMPADK